MKGLRIYAYAGCDTCRKALKFFQGKGVEAVVLPIREQPPTRTELQAMLGYVGGDVRRLFNTSGQDYRALGIKDRISTMSADEALDLLAGNGNLIKRPFAIWPKGGLVGFRPGDWEAVWP